MHATDGTWPEADSASESFSALARPLLIGLLALTISLGMLLCVRRLSDALTTPLAPLELVALAIVMLLLTTVARLRLRFAATRWLIPLAIALVAIGCSFPGERAVDWLVWLGVAAVYGLVPATPTRRSSPAIGDAAELAPEQRLLQQVSRLRDSAGGEVVRGTVLAEFAPGVRSATLHVAFCPPFERLPVIEAEPVDGPDCDAKVTQLLHQGARLEVRLSRASTVTERVTVEFMAIETPPLAV